MIFIPPPIKKKGRRPSILIDERTYNVHFEGLAYIFSKVKSVISLGKVKMKNTKKKLYTNKKEWRTQKMCAKIRSRRRDARFFVFAKDLLLRYVFVRNIGQKAYFNTS